MPDLGNPRYRIVREIGRGGMGVVYQVRDTTLDREVALKMLSLSSNFGETVERLRREARILASLEHPGVVPVHDAGVLPDGRVFYAMKLVRGTSIAEQGQSGSLSDRLRLFLRICEPVAFAHARGVIHRDLKPANVMVGPFGEVLVMDWGIAKAVGDDDASANGSAAERDEPITGHGTVIGTPGFMAPEQESGRNHETDVRTDVWSLGALLRYLVGEVDRNDAPARTRKPLEAIIRTASAEAPRDRYESVERLAEDVRRLLDGERVSVYQPSAIELVASWASRHQAAIAVVAAYLVMRLVLFLVFRT